MTESLMTEAATTTEGSPESTDAASTLYSNKEQAAPEKQSADVQSQAPDEKVEETGDTEGETEREGAPENYEFKAPEGMTFDEEVIETFSVIAKEINLPQKDAQKMLETVGPIIAQRQKAQVDAVHQQWIESAQTDKQYGGPQLAENLSVAKKALDAWGNPELGKFLNESGVGNHPELIRFMVNAGKSLAEEKFVGNSTGAGVKNSTVKGFGDMASALYSNQS